MRLPNSPPQKHTHTAPLTRLALAGCSTDWERFTEFASEVATQAEEEEEAEKALVEEREHREAMHQR